MMEKPKEITDKNPFKVPGNYFEEVNRKIISETSGYNQEVKKIGLYNRLKPYFLIAASITGFIILSYTAIHLLTPEKTNSQLSEVLFDEYNDIYINDIDILTLEESAASVMLLEESPDISKTDIIDYLLLENIDINDIYEQL
ncbi:MAG TPA: hypothetical protein VMV77_08450 [Bacteroidales bacterium]|nr:hypothetical protein [Bacteroidales bacterium]HUX56989.1 hypothetical protein [Bacteroidales bacterium]